MPPNSNKSLTPAEKQRRYREKRKLDLEREHEYKKKAIERYHKNKNLIQNQTTREKKESRRKWRTIKRNQRKSEKNLQTIVHNTPPSTLTTANILNAANNSSWSSKKKGRNRQTVDMAEEEANEMDTKEYIKLNEHNLSEAMQIEDYKETITLESVTEPIAGSSNDMNFEITVIDERKLIELVKHHKCIYDTTDESYGIAKCVNDVWEDIGNRINVTPKQCSVIWMNLRLEYSKHFERKKSNTTNDLVKYMHFLWPFYVKRFCNEVSFASNNDKFILDDDGLVCDGFNYRLIRTVQKYPNIYRRNSLLYDECNQSAWENISQKLDETVKYCVIQWLRLRKYYIASLVSKFGLDSETVKPKTKFEFRMKFLYPEIRNLIPNSRENFYNSPGDIVLSDNEKKSRTIYPSSSTSHAKLPSVIIPIPQIQNKYSTEFKRKFIAKMEGYPQLYWDNTQEMDLWLDFTKVDSKMLSDPKECSNLWSSLKNTYISITRKTSPIRKSKKVVINWEFYEDMKFLWPYYKYKNAKPVEVIVDTTLTENIESRRIAVKENRHIYKFYNTQQEEVFKFIELVKKFPVLYMNKKLGRSVGKLKQQTWNSVANSTPWHSMECRELWQILHTEYVSYINDKKTGSTDMIYKDAMAFLNEQLEKEGLIPHQPKEYCYDPTYMPDNPTNTLLTKLQVINLMQSVKKFPLLYDNTELAESCENKLWNAVSRDINISPKICAEKWAELRRKYIYVTSKTILTLEELFYANYMAFLAPFIKENAPSIPTIATPQDTMDYDSLTSEDKFATAKNIILVVQKFPRIYLRSPSNKGAVEDFIKIGKILKIPSSICEKIFRNAEQNYLNRAIDRTLDPSLDPYILEKEMAYMKPEVDKKVYKWIINNGNRLLSIVAGYPEIHSYNSLQAQTSYQWKFIAVDMKWPVKNCKNLWQLIIKSYEKQKRNGFTDDNWEFKKDFNFVEKTDSSRQSVDDSVWNLTLDIFNLTLISEVKKYPCLYDLRVKVRNKESIWQYIATMLFSTPENIKKQWTRLKNIFIAVVQERIEGPIDKMQEILNELSFLKGVYAPKKIRVKTNENSGKGVSVRKYERKRAKPVRKEPTDENVSNAIHISDIGAETFKSNAQQEDIHLNNNIFQFMKEDENVIEPKLEKGPELFTDTIPTNEYFTITKLYSDSESDLEMEDDVKVADIKVDNDDVLYKAHGNERQKRIYQKPGVFSARDIVKKRKN